MRPRTPHPGPDTGPVPGVSLLRILRVGLAGIAVAAVIGIALPSRAASAPERIVVDLSEFEIAMPDTLPAGPTEFVVRNDGQAEHNVQFDGPGVERALAANLMGGESDTLLIDLRPGSYRVWCPVGRHADYGMEMTLVVIGGGTDDGSAGSAGPPSGPAEPGPLRDLVRWLGRFHLPAVNFPIALLVAASLAELLFARTGRPPFDHAARFCTALAAAGAIVSGLLGWFLAGFSVGDDDTLLSLHRWLGTGTVVAAAAAWLLGERARGSDPSMSRRPYRVALAFGSVLVLVNGFLGGAMVFGLDHYAWP